MSDPLLAAAIEGFRDHPEARRCRTPKGATGLCETNLTFAEHCWQRGLDVVPVWFALPSPRGPDPGRGLHVEVWSGVFIDWSARQYNRAAPVPRLVDGDRIYRSEYHRQLALICEPGDAATLRAAGLAPVEWPSVTLTRPGLEDSLEVTRLTRFILLQQATSR